MCLNISILNASFSPPSHLMSAISGKVALLPKSSSEMSSTRASAERLIMAFVTTPWRAIDYNLVHHRSICHCLEVHRLINLVQSQINLSSFLLTWEQFTDQFVIFTFHTMSVTVCLPSCLVGLLVHVEQFTCLSQGRTQGQTREDVPGGKRRRRKWHDYVE